MERQGGQGGEFLHWLSRVKRIIAKKMATKWMIYIMVFDFWVI